jgi:hypothetical protein
MKILVRNAMILEWLKKKMGAVTLVGTVCKRED